MSLRSFCALWIHVCVTSVENRLKPKIDAGTFSILIEFGEQCQYHETFSYILSLKPCKTNQASHNSRLVPESLIESVHLHPRKLSSAGSSSLHNSSDVPRPIIIINFSFRWTEFNWAGIFGMNILLQVSREERSR